MLYYHHRPLLAERRIPLSCPFFALLPSRDSPPPAVERTAGTELRRPDLHFRGLSAATLAAVPELLLFIYILKILR